MPDAPSAVGLVRALFQGRLELAGAFPYPWPSADVRETADSIVEAVSGWAEQTIDPVAIDREKHIPEPVTAGLAELGLFGLTIPEEYGGAGQGQYVYTRVMEAVARRCASTVTVLGAHLGIGMKALLLYGSAEQKKRWLPSLATGERIAAFALTEAGAGSDAAGLRSSADELEDGSFRLDGRKVWITNGGIANFFTVFARTTIPGRAGAPLMERPISAFAVPRELGGVSHGVPEQKMGLTGSSTTEIALEDVRVPADHLLGARGEGFKVALNVLNAGRHGLAACCIGQAKLARGLALAHARERVQFGRPIASFGMVQEMLAGMEADIYAMEAGTWLTAGLVDGKRHEYMLESACCKTFATEALWRLANDALQVTGGTGFMREYPYERILRDSRINMIFEGTNQVLRLMLATQGLRGVDPRAAPAPRPVLAGVHARPGLAGVHARPGLAGVHARPGLAGVHDALAAEARAFEELVPRFAAAARSTLLEHGPAVREAQLALARLADMAIALFGWLAVLARASSELEQGVRDADRVASVATLACRRFARSFHHAESTHDGADDGLVSAVATRMT